MPQLKKPLTTPHGILFIIFVMKGLFLTPAQGKNDPAWNSYEVYQPLIERGVVVDASAQELLYNHDVSIAWFGDRWFCLWNANSLPGETERGQLNYFSTSFDGMLWSAPRPAFSDPEFCENPVPCETGTQWQPNLIVVGNQLWALWSQNSDDPYNGCYLSILESPDGKWKNRLLTWNDHCDPVIDGKSWRVFPTQNPIQLSTGRILAPVSMEGPVSESAPPGATAWAWLEKRNSVIYTDDEGITWHVSPGTQLPGFDWRQWEPTVFEQPDGSVMMFARNNLMPGREGINIPPATETLTWSISYDEGETWSPHDFVPIQTVISRMQVLRQNEDMRPTKNDRYLMLHNDWLVGPLGFDRRNIALFVNRGGGMDFTAGIGLTSREFQVSYPQMWIHNDTLLAAYSQGPTAARNINVVRITPLPDLNQRYIYPRSNIPEKPMALITGEALHLSGGATLKSRIPPEVSIDGLSLVAWIKVNDDGPLFDNRGKEGGLVWSLFGTPFIHVFHPDKNIRSHLPVPRGRWTYIGLTLDYDGGSATFYVNDKYHRVRFSPGSRSMFDPKSATIGGPNPAGSSLPDFNGAIASLDLYGSHRLSTDEHLALFQSQAASFGFELKDKKTSTQPNVSPTLSVDPGNKTALARDFILPPTPADTIQDGAAFIKEKGKPLLRITGTGSAGVELSANKRSDGDSVDLVFSFRLEEKGKEQVLCAVGDANQPAEVVVRGNEIVLRAGEQNVFAGKAKPGSWQNLALKTRDHFTQVAVDHNKPVQVKHAPKATWVYLGDGYRSDFQTDPGVFSIDVNTVKSRIIPEENP